MKTIVITGPDGSGKSTLLAACEKRLRRCGFSARATSVWDALKEQSFFRSRRDIFGYLSELRGLSRLCFILHGLAMMLEAAKRDKRDFLLIDSYWFKYFLTEQKLHQEELREDLFSVLPEPDLVLVLKTPLEVIFRRKQTFSSYECGEKDPTPENFMTFQQEVHQSWDFWLLQKPDWIDLPGTEDPHTLEKLAVSHMLNIRLPEVRCV